MAYGEQLTNDTREYITTTHFDVFQKEDVVKLLSLVDEENMIGRGTTGQSVEALISSLPECTELLEAVLNDKSLPRFTREVATLIYAMHHPKESLHYLKELTSEGSWYMGEMVEYIQEWECFNPYS